jgi:hypothetical protein
MFPGLDQVPWSSLRHALGSAGDVPVWFGYLESHDQKRRELGWASLEARLCARGAVFEATAHAVPFLVEVMGRGDGLAWGAAWLLLDIARATAPPEDPGWVWPWAAQAALRAALPALRARWVEAEAADRGGDAARALLLCAEVQPAPPELGEWLCAAGLSAAAAEVRFAAALALARVARGDAGCDAVAAALAEADADPGVRWMAAVAAVGRGVVPSADLAATVVAEYVGGGGGRVSELLDAVEPAPGADGLLRRMAAQAGDAALLPVVRAFIARWPRLGDRERVLAMILDLAFQEQKEVMIDVVPARVSPAQRAVLRFLVASPLVRMQWPVALLAEYGLPRTAQGIMTLLMRIDVAQGFAGTPDGLSAEEIFAVPPGATDADSRPDSAGDPGDG